MNTNLFGYGCKVVCIKNLSNYAQFVVTNKLNRKEAFPVVGETYIVTKCATVSKNLPFVLDLSAFDTVEDDLGSKFMWQSSWFVPECVAVNILASCGINLLKKEEASQKIKEIYEQGLWLP